MRYLLGVIALVVALLAPEGLAAQSATSCPPGESPHFAFGFAALKASIGAAMGDPVTCEFPDPNGTGDVHLRTTTGLAPWRKATNTPTFTNGWDHWASTAGGMVCWTGSSIDPREYTPRCPSYTGASPSGAKAGDGTAQLASPTPEQVFATHNGPKSVAQMSQELQWAGYDGPWDAASIRAAYDRATAPPTLAPVPPTPTTRPTLAPPPTSTAVPQVVGPAYRGQSPYECIWGEMGGRRVYSCIYPDGSVATWVGPTDNALLAYRNGSSGPVQFTAAGDILLGLAMPVPSAPVPGAITATITNDFTGYAPGRIFILNNGQIWRQTEAWYWYWYWYWYGPQVVIYPTSSGWKLHFDQIDHDVTVERVR